jgi:hypothetical protein
LAVRLLEVIAGGLLMGAVILLILFADLVI